MYLALLLGSKQCAAILKLFFTDYYANKVWNKIKSKIIVLFLISLIYACMVVGIQIWKTNEVSSNIHILCLIDQNNLNLF